MLCFCSFCLIQITLHITNLAGQVEQDHFYYLVELRMFSDIFCMVYKKYFSHQVAYSSIHYRYVYWETRIKIFFYLIVYQLRFCKMHVMIIWWPYFLVLSGFFFVPYRRGTTWCKALQDTN